METTALNPKAAWPFPPTREELRNDALEEAARLVEVEAASPNLTEREMHARLLQIAGHIRHLKRSS